MDKVQEEILRVERREICRWLQNLSEVYSNQRAEIAKTEKAIEKLIKEKEEIDKQLVVVTQVAYGVSGRRKEDAPAKINVKGLSDEAAMELLLLLQSKLK